MNLNILAKRLAEKTHTPILAQVILGEAPIEALPNECMVWTGARSFGQRHVRRKLQRGRDKFLYPTTTIVKPYGQITYQGKRMVVQRLVYQLLMNPPQDFRLTQLCQTDCCVNPLHWSMTPLREEADVEVEAPPEFHEGWNEAEVDEIVGVYFDMEVPSNWEEIVNHPLLQDVPTEMLRDALVRIHKEHLLC